MPEQVKKNLGVENKKMNFADFYFCICVYNCAGLRIDFL